MTEASGSAPHGLGSPALITGVLRYYRISILIVVALLIAGAWSFITLPRGEDPEFDAFDCRRIDIARCKNHFSTCGIDCAVVVNDTVSRVVH